MDDFLKKVLDVTGVEPPAWCVESMKRNFETAVSIDWSERPNDRYEAIFYQEGIEYIALFQADGTLIQYKMYLPKDLLPAQIRQDLESAYEIMNVVLINEGNHLLYEVIVRDRDLHRRLVLVDGLGKIQEERSL